jgi:hypothetical protein
MNSDVVLEIIALESRETGFAQLQTVEWRYGRRCSALLTDLNQRGLLAWGLPGTVALSMLGSARAAQLAV